MATETNDNRDGMGLEQQIKAMHAELQENLKQARRRAARVGVVMTLLVVAILGYWCYLYSSLEAINAESASAVAYQKAVDYAKAAPPVLSKALRDRAPEVFDYAEAQILQSPAMVADYIRSAALQQTQMVLDDSEPKIKQVIGQAISHALAASQQTGFDGKDPAQLDSLIDAIALQMRSDVKQSLDQVYGEYDNRAQQAVAYLEKVAAGQNLDERQQHLRQVIVSFLAVSEKRKTMQ